MKTWKFRLPEDYEHCCKYPAEHAITFKAENGTPWLEILRSGIIRVKKGYAWDGCSPKFKIGDLMLIGIPDGTPDPETGLPVTYHASLIHDALYQFIDHPDMPYSRDEIDEIFHDILLDAGFSLANLYYYIVKFAGRFFI